MGFFGIIVLQLGRSYFGGSRRLWWFSAAVSVGRNANPATQGTRLAGRGFQQMGFFDVMVLQMGRFRFGGSSRLWRVSAVVSAV
ncbi:hypothetical protein C1H46_021372 [Malus baccata]|uniref:Uncharacterized protein n=1 Tax=Malus baccata TaxID=106549 RepID=A0A540M314_MALBA|nr:hypothetical protein C1H46_021372 [Malus baccata]